MSWKTALYILLGVTFIIALSDIRVRFSLYPEEELEYQDC